MRKRLLMLLLALTMATTVVTGCGMGGNDGPVNRKESSDKDDDDDDEDEDEDDREDRDDRDDREDNDNFGHSGNATADVAHEEANVDTVTSDDTPAFADNTVAEGEYYVKTYYSNCDNSYFGLFSEGLAWVYLYEEDYTDNYYYNPKYVAAINTDGRVCVAYDYENTFEDYYNIYRVTPFINGVAVISNNNGRFIVVDTNGNELFVSTENDYFIGRADDGTIFYRHKTATMSEVKWDFCRLLENYESQTLAIDTNNITLDYLYSTEACYALGGGSYSIDSYWINIFTGEAIYGSNVVGKSGDYILFSDSGDMSFFSTSEIAEMTLQELHSETYYGNDGDSRFICYHGVYYVGYDEALHGPQGFTLNYCELITNALENTYDARFSNIENGYQAIILRGADSNYYSILIDVSTGNTVYEPVKLDISSIPVNINLVDGYTFANFYYYDNQSLVISNTGEVLDETPAVSSNIYFDNSVALWQEDDTLHVSEGYITWAGTGYVLTSTDGRDQIQTARIN